MTEKSKLPTLIGPEEIVFEGKIIAVAHQRMQIGGKEKTFERAIRSPGTRLIIISPENKILITREYRHDFADWDFRLPGGKVCDTLEEYLNVKDDPDKLMALAISSAKKEAREEVGIEVTDLSCFDVTQTAAPTIKHDLFYFLITKFKILPGQSLGEGENISIGWHTIREAIDICLSGEMKEDRSIGVLLRYLHSIGKI
jgi:8-oxo-dGTP pyrophosphatase MutT (NUDIX family)